jgi:HEAT repeat protein
MTAPALIAAMSDRRMHEAAGDALVKIGPDTVPALAEAITNPDVSVRLGVVRTLGKFGPDAKDALKPLNTAFYMEKDDDVTKAIRETMARIEGKP